MWFVKLIFVLSSQALDAIAESENACLKDAAIELKNSREFGGRYESSKTNLFFSKL